MTQGVFDDPTFAVAMLEKELIAAKDAAVVAEKRGERQMLTQIIGIIDALMDDCRSTGELFVLNEVLVAVEELLPEEERR